MNHAVRLDRELNMAAESALRERRRGADKRYVAQGALRRAIYCSSNLSRRKTD